MTSDAKMKPKCQHYRDNTGKCIYCGDKEDYRKIERRLMGQVKKNTVPDELIKEVV